MKEQGASLVEMISVLLLMGIVAGVIVSRIAAVDDMELAAKVNSIRNHIRYTQIMAMKRNDLTWGIKCDGTDYWVFKTATPDVAAEPDDPANMVLLPGQEDKQIAMPEMDNFTLYFDKFGIPYAYVTNEIVPRIEDLTIQIGTRSLTVTEETGFIE